MRSALRVLPTSLRRSLRPLRPRKLAAAAGWASKCGCGVDEAVSQIREREASRSDRAAVSLAPGGDLSFVLVSCVGLETTERSLEVVFVFFFFQDRDEVVKIEIALFVGGVVVILVGVIEIIITKNVVERNVWNLWLGFTVICFQIV
jgi:hypothetical protein